jgi:hypothetical protein
MCPTLQYVQGLVDDSGLVLESREIVGSLYSLLVESDQNVPPALATRGYEATRTLSSVLKRVSRDFDQSL